MHRRLAVGPLALAVAALAAAAALGSASPADAAPSAAATPRPAARVVLRGCGQAVALRLRRGQRLRIVNRSGHARRIDGYSPWSPLRRGPSGARWSIVVQPRQATKFRVTFAGRDCRRRAGSAAVLDVTVR